MGPALNDPIYKVKFTNIFSLFSSPNFPIMIAPTQIAFQALLPSE